MSLHVDHMSGHRPEVLQQCDSGCVVFCPGCSRYQVTFGTFCLSQDLSQLNQFSGIVKLYLRRYWGRLPLRQRDLQIDTPYPGFCLMMSLDDLTKLNDLLQKSLLLIDSRTSVRQS